MTSTHRIWMALWLILAPAVLLAQSQPPAANPSLKASVNGVRDASHARALGLRRFDVSVEMRGAVAETTVTVAFANPLSETLEGDFRLALPAGAVVTGYALDISGQMVDGVLVDRPRAKAVYEERLRRGVDPGLAEVLPGNVFQTRIFPINPHAGRTIRVRFVVPVAADGGYRLPVSIEAPTDGWSIAVQASGVRDAPVVTLPDRHPLTLQKTADGFAARAEGKSEAVSGTLGIARAAMPDLLLSRHASGEYELQLGGILPASADGPASGTVRIYWDRSRSRLDSRTDAEIALLRRYIETAKLASVELVAFNSTGAERHVATSGADAAAWLGALRYRGATSFAALTHDTPVDRCLLFSDGGATIDRDTGFAPPCRLDVISASATADTAWLRHLAAVRGGRAYALGAGANDDVLAGLSGSGGGVVAVLDQDGRSLPFIPLDAPAGRWLILARAPAGGPVTVRLGSSEVRLAVGGEAVRFDGDGALIASDTLATLGATDQRSAFVDLSRRFGIASPSLSFLVLELPGDYIAAGIEPPASYPAEQRDAWARLRKQTDGEMAKAQGDRLDTLAKQWADQVAWWKKRFDPAARPKRIATSQNFDRTEAPAPPPPPVMAAPAPATEPSDSAAIVVTGARAPIRRSSNQVVDAISASDVGNLPDRSVTEALQRVPGLAASRFGGARDADDAGTRIEVDAWQPDRPYLELYDGAPAQFDARFLEAQARHGTLPAFYLDTAEWLRKHGRTAEASEMVLSAIELPTANEVTLGIVADRLERYGQIDRAIELRERQAVLDPDRPQPKRLLALALARRAALQPARARADLERAVQLLNQVAVTPLDPRWNGIDLIALVEANALLPKLRQLGGKVELDPRLIALMDVDIRIVVDWSTDASDLDLWVDEPNRERAIYNNQRTAIGGHLSDDMTQGYGPEEYLLHRAIAGIYTVQANVFAPDRLDPNGASVLSAHLFRNYGRPDQSEEAVDIELTRDEKGSKMIGRIEVPKAAEKKP